MFPSPLGSGNASGLRQADWTWGTRDWSALLRVPPWPSGRPHNRRPCAWGSGHGPAPGHAPVLPALSVLPCARAAGSGSVGPAPPSLVLSALSVLPYALLAAVLPSGHWAHTALGSTPPGQEPTVSLALPIGLSWEDCRGLGQGLRPWLLALFSLFLLQEPGRGTLCRSCPQAPFRLPGAPGRASPTHTAALEGGWRPRRAQQRKTHYVETASLGKPWVERGGS